jgi:hypothetical protein
VHGFRSSTCAPFTGGGAFGRSSSTEKKRATLELWAAYLAKERFVVDLIGVRRQPLIKPENYLLNASRRD